MLVYRIPLWSLVVALAASPTVAQTKPGAASGAGGTRLAARAFQGAAERVLPSIVTIESYGGTTAGARRGRIAGISRPRAGPTTGTIISADGYILTSTFNFADNPPIITVVLNDGSKHVAELLGRDDALQLCLLKIEVDKDLPVAERMSARDLRVGQWAISVGIGYGDFEPAISSGIISALARHQGRAVQTDANVSPANYGGPLLAIDGRVIGICVPLNPLAKGGTAGAQWYDSGIGFALPLTELSESISKMKAGREVRPAANPATEPVPAS